MYEDLTHILTQYLETQKIFIQNPLRMMDVNKATETACRMFPEANVTIEDDPLQMGAVFLCIEDFDISVKETKQFSDMISKADNFVIHNVDEENIKIMIMFSDALIRIAP